MLCGFFRMVSGMQVVTMRNVGMMPGQFLNTAQNAGRGSASPLQLWLAECDNPQARRCSLFAARLRSKGTNRRLTPELGSWREAVKKGVIGRRKIGLASLLPIRRFSEQCTAVQNRGRYHSRTRNRSDPARARALRSSEAALPA